MLPDSVYIPFNDLNDLLAKVPIVKLEGVQPFTFSGFSRDELEKILSDPKCDGIIFLPAILQPVNTLTLLAVGVDDIGGGGIEIVSPAVLSDCPPRCKEQPAKEELVANFIPRITLKTSVV